MKHTTHSEQELREQLMEMVMDHNYKLVVDLEEMTLDENREQQYDEREFIDRLMSLIQSERKKVKKEMLQGQKDAFEAGSKLGYKYGFVAQELTKGINEKKEGKE